MFGLPVLSNIGNKFTFLNINLMTGGRFISYEIEDILQMGLLYLTIFQAYKSVEQALSP